MMDSLFLYVAYDIVSPEAAMLREFLQILQKLRPIHGREED
jgi:hypothetical protein